MRKLSTSQQSTYLVGLSQQQQPPTTTTTMSTKKKLPMVSRNKKIPSVKYNVIECAHPSLTDEGKECGLHIVRQLRKRSSSQHPCAGYPNHKKCTRTRNQDGSYSKCKVKNCDGQCIKFWYKFSVKSKKVFDDYIKPHVPLLRKSIVWLKEMRRNKWTMLDFCFYLSNESTVKRQIKYIKDLIEKDCNRKYEELKEKKLKLKNKKNKMINEKDDDKEYNEWDYDDDDATSEGMIADDDDDNEDDDSDAGNNSNNKKEKPRQLKEKKIKIKKRNRKNMMNEIDDGEDTESDGDNNSNNKPPPRKKRRIETKSSSSSSSSSSYDNSEVC